MNKDIAIKVENVSKVYKLYNAPIDRMKEALNPFKKNYHKEFYALNDVSFEIKKGEIVGVIGKNGSGKSTILKIITGVLNPTSGNVIVNGRISALLELGAGFNPEYTGMENIYFQGNLMGFSREEMHEKVAAILNFAEIGDFIHQPVKNYSSGMFARLAFAVAINIEPEILIVDEALSVGDAFFQTKCMDKMVSLMRGGTTVLFVSHDISAIRSFCNRAILLEGGEMKLCGGIAEVTGLYMQDHFLQNNEDVKEHVTTVEECVVMNNRINPNFLDDKVLHSSNYIEQDIACLRRYGSNKASILNVELYNENNELANEIESCSECHLVLVVKFNVEVNDWAIVTPVCSLNGVQQFGASSAVIGYKFPNAKAGDVFGIKITHRMPIKDGLYNFTISIEEVLELNAKHEFLDVIEACLPFKVGWGDKRFPTMFYVDDVNIKLGKLS